MRGHHLLDAPPGARIAGFTVERLLGAGGCGVVYRAARGREVVALKLQALTQPGGWAWREVSILQRLKHRNVVGLRGWGLLQEPVSQWGYLAMEYVHGRTLAQWVEEENPGARRAAELLRGMARGLEAAHAAEVLHRDLKESNVMVREEDGEAVLVDFGAGDCPGAPHLASCLLPPGTQRYRSPEALAFQRDSRPGQHACYVPAPTDDLYALGVVFYWVLTARHPFGGTDTPAQVEAAILQPPVPPDVLNPRVPRALAAVCLRLLSKRPEARGSASGLCEAVEAALAEADADWETPLCEAPSPALAARRGDGEALPPRGPRAKAGPLEAPALVVRAHAMSPARPGGVPRLAVLLGMVAFLGGAVHVARTRPSGDTPAQSPAPARAWDAAPPLVRRPAPAPRQQEDVPAGQPPELSARAAPAQVRR